MADTPKILIVDDKPENLFVLEKVLRETEAQVITAYDGNEALKAALEYDFAQISRCKI